MILLYHFRPIKMSIQLVKKIEKAHKLDEIGYKIICQLISGSDNKNISSTLHIALSTIQEEGDL
jgi:ATP/maltotriose-dependent transcriptional regulator MalT